MKLDALKRLYRRVFRGSGRLARWSARAEKGRAPRLTERKIARLTPEQRTGVSLLRANMAGNDSEWLAGTNAYLAAQGLAAIRLREGRSPLYHRLESGVAASSTGGSSIAVLMSAFNAEATLDLAVRSIVEQTWKDWELWIVDDRSTDRTPELARAWVKRDARIRFWSSPVNVGPYVLRNWALRQSSARWVTVHDADDWAHPQRLERQVVWQEAHPEWFGHVGSWVRVDESGRYWAVPDAAGNTDGFLKTSPVTAFFDRKTLVERLGGWDSIRFSGDIEFLARVKAARLALGAQPMLLVFGLDHAASLSADVRLGKKAVRTTVPDRKIYRQEFEAWHRSPGFSPKVDPFAQRVFSAPAGMTVAPDLLKQVEEGSLG